MPSEVRNARPARDTSETNTPQPEPQPREKKPQRSMNGTLDGWVEPAIATKPSFEDHGGVGYGVVEHLQPLGEPPSARVRARVKGEGTRKSMLGRSAAGAGLDAQETPESTPGPPPPEPAHTELDPPPNIVIDDDNDDDYAPDAKKSKKKKRVSEPRAPKRLSASARASEGPSTKKAKWEPQRDTNSNKPNYQSRTYHGQPMSSIVEEAKRRAQAVDKPELAAAVHEIYMQSLNDLRLAELLETILLQKANPAQVEEFQVYVKKAKKKLRAAKEQEQRNLPGEASSSKSLALRSPAKTETTPKLPENTSALPSTERPPDMPKKLSLKVKSPPKAGEHRHSTTASKKSISPKKKQPAKDDDDISDLSELTELSEGEDMAVDTPETAMETPAAPSAGANGFHIRDQAAERGSLGVQGRNLKRSSAEADFQETEEDRTLAAKKQKLSGAVTRDFDYQESGVRSSLNGQPRNARAASARTGSVMPPKISLQPNTANAGAEASRANSTDVDSPLSSPALSSRRSTPQAWKGPLKPAGKRAKTKTSPDKRNQAAFVGMPGTSGAGRPSPIGDDDNEEASENNDFCSSCGGSGYLLCCDGCDRSFHFTCLDPPLGAEASELNEPWFCFVCVGKRPLEQPEKAARGLFAPLLNNLNKVNPSTFTLPQDLRDHFEGVGTAKNGDFLEVVKPKARHRAGLEDRPDDFKLKDSKGNPMLCYSCGKSSLGKRAIISCDHVACGQNWHLDCLDPPLANPPGRDAIGSKTGDWMCPLHVDHDLRRVDARLLAPRRTLHIRRPKQAKTVPTSLRRGLQNNGIIEVVNDSSDDSDSEFYEVEDSSKETPVVYQMPAKGIVQDFIHQVKQKRIRNAEEYHAAKRIKLVAASLPSQLQQANFARRSIRDQQTALSLAQFANANQDLELGSDRVENLVGALIAEAPAAVVDNIAAAEETTAALKSSNNAPPLSPPNSEVEHLTVQQRKDLEALQELIKRKLEGTAGTKT